MQQTKICSKCKKKKFTNKFYKQKRGKYGRSSICKICKRKYSQTPKRKSKAKQYRKSIRGQLSRQREILKRHNITLAEYDQMFKNQNGVCAICNLPEINGRLSIDHNHQTGKIRGLLCRSCNVLLGYLERIKNDGFIKKAEKYLRNYS